MVSSVKRDKTLNCLFKTGKFYRGKKKVAELLQVVIYKIVCARLAGGREKRKGKKKKKTEKKREGKKKKEEEKRWAYISLYECDVTFLIWIHDIVLAAHKRYDLERSGTILMREKFHILEDIYFCYVHTEWKLRMRGPLRFRIYILYIYTY